MNTDSTNIDSTNTGSTYTDTTAVIVQDNGKVDGPMVGWYDPSQLIKTAASVVVSTLFGRHADFRLLEALASHSEPHAFTVADDVPFWFDYAADVGDGWNPTYAVAYWISRRVLQLRDNKGGVHDTERGGLLLFGGDGVYPVASRGDYQQKLVAPYAAALSDSGDQSPVLFALPGNHDWYDSLAGFMRLFCSGRWFGGWKTQQTASYFAVELPRGWWLIGVDIQLDSDIDEPQVTFLRAVKAKMQDTDRVILCVAEPHWIYAQTYGKNDSDYSENNLAFIEEKIFTNQIAVYIAGDLHHYRRHASSNNIQKITAGGGGAFLHPTHGADVAQIGDFALQAAFPDTKTSRRLGWRNLGFLALNPAFGVVTGILYLLTGWATNVDISRYGLSEFGTALARTTNKALNEPTASFWIVALFLGFYLFTDTHSRWYRYVAGTLHGLAHLLTAFLLGWGATRCIAPHYAFGSTPQLLLSGLAIFAGGWIVGSCIMGIYLLISLNVFKRHSNEAFSSLKIQDWKNFLRLKIDQRGDLTIYPIGLRRVPRLWQRVMNAGKGEAQIVPHDTRATPPELIEPPIMVTRTVKR